MEYSDGLNARAGAEGGEMPPSDADWADRRVYVRFPFKGSDFRIQIGNLYFNLRLRDLSCGGASGLCDAPMAVGDIVYMELDKSNRVAAEVLWIRRVLIGLRFVNDLNPMLVRKVHAARTKAESRLR